MNRFGLCLALAVVVAVICVESAPGGKRGKGPKRGGSCFEVTKWNRTVDSNNVAQRAAYNDTEQILMVFTPRKNKKATGVFPSATLYDFPDSQAPLTMIRAGRQCFIIENTAGLDYTTASGNAEARNGTNVTDALTEVALSAVGAEMSADERNTSIGNYPILKRFCFRAKMYTTSAATLPASGSEANGQKVMTFVTLDSKVSLLAEFPGRMGGPGGRKGPKKPKGGRRPNGQNGRRRGGNGRGK